MKVKVENGLVVVRAPKFVSRVMRKSNEVKVTFAGCPACGGTHDYLGFHHMSEAEVFKAEMSLSMPSGNVTGTFQTECPTTRKPIYLGFA